jgi:hypothetical protein
MSGRRNRQAGLALMLVLMVVVISSVLAMTYLAVTSVKLAGANNLRYLVRARYLAESGIQHAIWLIRTDPDAFAGHDGADPLGPFYADGSQDRYVFFGSAGGAGSLTYTITARGTAGNVTQTATARAELSSDYLDKIQGLGPLAYWRLGETSGVIADDCVGANDGLYANGVGLGAAGAIVGDTDCAAHFDGINDYVNLGNLDVDSNELTIVAWFRADDFAVHDARIISKAYGTMTSQHYWMLSTYNVAGQMRLRSRLRCGGTTSVLTAGSGNLVAGQWIFAVAVYNGSHMKLYKDAVLVGQLEKTGPVSTDNTVAAWIGNNPSGETSRPFHGLIDDMAIFDKALSEDEIETLYKARAASVRMLSWGD